MRRSTSALEARIAAARAPKRPVALTSADVDDADSELDYMDTDSDPPQQQSGQARVFVDVGDGDDDDDDDSADEDGSGGEAGARASDVDGADSDLGLADDEDDPEYGQDPRFRVDVNDCADDGNLANAPEDVARGQRAAEGGGALYLDYGSSRHRSSRLVVPDTKALKVYAYSDVPSRYREEVDAQYDRRLKAHERVVAKKQGTPDWTDAEKAKVRDAEASKFMARRHLSRPLPSYKHMARELAPSEREAMGVLRRKIDCALRTRPMTELPGDGPAPRQAAEAHRHELLVEALDNDDPDAFLARAQDIAQQAGIKEAKRVAEAAYADVARAPLLTEPCEDDKEQLAELARMHGVTEDAMIDEYLDFMNEARRHVLRTIRQSNIKAKDAWRNAYQQDEESWHRFTRSTWEQLTAEMEADDEEEFRMLFERESDAPPRRSRGGDAADDSANGAGAGAGTGEARSCSNVPGLVVISWHALEDVGTDASQTTAAQEVEDKKWIQAEFDGSQRDGQVKPLWTQNHCNPCLPWAIPKVGELGFWKAAKRIRMLKGEISMSDGTKDVPKWQETGRQGQVVDYNLAFEADPLIAVQEDWGKGKVVLMDQLIRKYFRQAQGKMLRSQRDKSKAQSAEPDNNWTHNNMHLTMLRCFPVRRTDDGALNPIVDFVCWWHKNITVPGTVMDPKAPDEVHADKTSAKRHSLFYRLMCAPDCKTLIKHNKDPLLEQVDKWRGNTHVRVAVIRKYFEMLKIAMDIDVFDVDPSESLLYNGRGFHAQMVAAAQADLAQANAELAQAQQRNANPALAQRAVDAAQKTLDDRQAKLKTTIAVPPAQQAAAREVYETWRRYNPGKANPAW